MFPTNTSITTFRNNIKNAIILLTSSEESPDDKELLELYLANDIPYAEVIEIHIFLPIACVRQMLPNLKWPEHYMENGKSGKFKYAETETYLIIFDEVKQFIQNAPGYNSILKIAGRSAEFQAINKIFLNNPNLEVTDIQLTETIVCRDYTKKSI